MKQKNMVLMVVAVGCGLVAAFLTANMNAKPQQVEMRGVLVAVKDIPVGTTLSEDDLKEFVKLKQLPKDSIGKDVIDTEKDLVGKRLTRAVRTDETFNKADLSKGGVVTIPEGYSMVTLPMNAGQAVAGFAGPGSRVDIVTSVRLENKLTALPLLVNMLVLAIDGQTTYPKEGVFSGVSMVSFAANRSQALVLELAKSRGCQMNLVLRSPDAVQSVLETGYSIESVISLLQDDKNPIRLEGFGGDVNSKKPATGMSIPSVAKMEDPKVTETVKVDEPVKPVEPSKPVEPKVVVKETVKVPVALEDIKAGTPITKDLLADTTKFGTRELPKEFAQDALTHADLSEMLGQVFRTGLGKGQWATKSLVGSQEAKAAPPDEPLLPKGGEPEPAPKAQRRTHDVTIHTSNEARTYRYEEIAPGKLRFLYEVRPDSKPANEAEFKVPEKKVD